MSQDALFGQWCTDVVSGSMAASNIQRKVSHLSRVLLQCCTETLCWTVHGLHVLGLSLDDISFEAHCTDRKIGVYH